VPLSRNARIGLAVGVAGAAAAAALVIVPGTFGGFTSETTNPGNQVVTGTLQMTNTAGNGAAVISESLNPGSGNLKPGDEVASSVTIGNSGTLGAAMALAVATATPAVGADDLATQLNLVITRTDGDDVVVVDEPLRSASGQTYALGQWLAGESHTYEVRLELSDDAGNAYQGETAAFTLTWSGAQL